ncbi:MAG: hypothetical protein BGO50_14210 [Rhodanobacter sp. 67-28]|nr:MAG: hypothetical protein BGO50_14210 [Rhodanobacter sp. 67-28]
MRSQEDIDLRVEFSGLDHDELLQRHGQLREVLAFLQGESSARFDAMEANVLVEREMLKRAIAGSFKTSSN